MRGQPSPNGCGLRNIMRHNGIHRTGARFAARMLAPAIVAGLLAPLAVATGAQARDQIVSLSVAQSKSIRVSKGKPQTIRTDAAFYEIVIGDTEIANVNPLTDKSFYVLGNKLGTTGIALFDEQKQLVGTVDIEVTLDTDRLASTIRETIPEADIKVESANGRVVLSGQAKDSVDAEKVEKIAKNFSGEEDVINSVSIGSSQQVQLNVRFVEINRIAGNELSSRIGASYNFGSGSVGISSNPGGIAANDPTSIVASLVSGGFSIDATIKALEDKGLARRLAEPNLIARSGEEASFLAGGEVPIPVAQDNNTISYIFKKYGVSLAFRPQVLKDGLISLEIEPEVSSIDGSNTFSVGSGINVPSFIVRRAHTAIDLKSGQSFMMAGLLQSQNEVIRKQIPLASKVPILGSLFASKKYQRNETDLVIIVTPHLVKPIDPTKKIATPGDKSVPSSPVDVILGDIDEIQVSDVDRAKLASVNAAAELLPQAGHFLTLRDDSRVKGKSDVYK